MWKWLPLAFVLSLSGFAAEPVIDKEFIQALYYPDLVTLDFDGINADKLKVASVIRKAYRSQERICDAHWFIRDTYRDETSGRIKYSQWKSLYVSQGVPLRQSATGDLVACTVKNVRYTATYLEVEHANQTNLQEDCEEKMKAEAEKAVEDSKMRTALRSVLVGKITTVLYDETDSPEPKKYNHVQLYKEKEGLALAVFGSMNKKDGCLAIEAKDIQDQLETLFARKDLKQAREKGLERVTKHLDKQDALEKIKAALEAK